MKKLLQVKRVETKKNYVTRKGTIKITQRHIDELNQSIVRDISQKEAIREKGLEIAENCVMK